jgi:oxygen-independent coproporphyrinogen-3 oxidase
VALKGRNPAPLVDRLIRELAGRTEGVENIRTVFVGGGTPTLLPLDLLDELLRAVGRCVCVGALEEFTVEANPATVDDAKAELLVRSGVSRVSMGVQSFHVAELATLERLHTPGDIAPSVATLRRNGVRQLNLDLIFGIPGQTMETWMTSLRRTIDLGPDHVACYGLTYEPATRLTALKNASKLTPCEEELEADMFLAAGEVLEAAGYEPYEISNYAKPGFQSRHNLLYWRNEPYIGVGPSAAGCVPWPGRGSSGGPVLRRHKNVADIAGYVRMMDDHGHAEAEHEFIEGETLALELILMQLRLNEGLHLARMADALSSQARSRVSAEVESLVGEELVQQGRGRVWLTRAGRLVANRVIGRLADAVTDSSGSQPWSVTLPVIEATAAQR